jgi:predicted house-cleaning noncanonical NTP pyrophosphatase (MazG superfamily)
MVYREDHPQYHVVKVRGMLHAVMKHCREDIEKVTEPKAQAIFATTAEVLDGLITAYNRYERELEEKDRGLAA